MAYTWEMKEKPIFYFHFWKEKVRKGRENACWKGGRLSLLQLNVALRSRQRAASISFSSCVANKRTKSFGQTWTGRYWLYLRKEKTRTNVKKIKAAQYNFLFSNYEQQKKRKEEKWFRGTLRVIRWRAFADGIVYCQRLVCFSLKSLGQVSLSIVPQFGWVMEAKGTQKIQCL